MKTNIDNPERCSHFSVCSRNLCVLDYELKFRTGKNSDRCRFMREPKKAKIAGKEFVSGGSVMPDVLLNFVPSENIDSLNEASRERLKELSSESHT